MVSFGSFDFDLITISSTIFLFFLIPTVSLIYGTSYSLYNNENKCLVTSCNVLRYRGGS